MIDRKKLFGVTLLLSIVIVISTYISWLLGFDGFLLYGNIEIPYAVQYIVNVLIFYIGFVFWAGIALKEYSLKILKITFPFLIFTAIANNFINHTFIITAVFPFLYILLVGFILKNFKFALKTNIIMFIVMNLYQIPMSFVKVNFLPFDQNMLSIYQGWMFSIDFIIFMLILYLYGGGLENYVSCKRIMDSKSRESSLSSNEHSPLYQEFTSLSKWEQRFTIACYCGIQIIQTFLILAVCHFVTNTFVQALLIMTSFALHGIYLKDRWHSNSIIVCTLISSTMFVAASVITPSIFILQLISVIIGLLLVYCLYKLKTMQSKKTFQKWKQTIVDLTIGKYSEIGNHKEVALAKGLTERDLELVGYHYYEPDHLAQLLGKLSPFSSGEYIRTSSEDDPH